MKNPLIIFICAVILSLFPTSDLPAKQEQRLALLIGNSHYTHGGSLPNPVNDVRAIKKALEALGFTVMKYEDCSQKTMKQAMDKFGRKLKGKWVGLFFYAGHGVQVRGNNYLLPVDAKLENANDAEYDCVRADRVLAKMEAAGSRTNIVILDACRDNPFERSWRRGTEGSGLAFMNAPSGSLIAYSTAPGKTALDGRGKNSPYTSALLQHIDTPNITVLQMFQRVRSTVQSQSDYKQTPWESTSLNGDFYFTTQGTDNEYSVKRARLEKERRELERLRAQIERKQWEAKQQRIEVASVPKKPTYSANSSNTTYLVKKGDSLYKIAKRFGTTTKAIQMANKLENPLLAIGQVLKIPNIATIIDRDGVYVVYANGIVRDTSTGLEWVVGPSKDMTWEEARAWVENLNLDGGGWRLPWVVELRTLYKKGTGINKTKREVPRLLKTNNWEIWSDGFLGSIVASVNVVGGMTFFTTRRSYSKNKCFAVRSRNPPYDQKYVVSSEGILKDNMRGLEWKFGPDKDLDWNEAKSWVQSLNLDGGGWRMPTQYELEDLNLESNEFDKSLLNITSDYLIIWSSKYEKGEFLVFGDDLLSTKRGIDNRAFAVRSRNGS